MASEESNDHLLKAAAVNGDVEYLRVCIAFNKPNDFYLTVFQPYGNIFHLAVLKNRVEFIREALNILPLQLIQQLLLHTMKGKWYKGNPLHFAAYNGKVEIVKMFLDVYRSSPFPSDHSKRPWLQKDIVGRTPCHVALSSWNEECGSELLSIDIKEISNIVDNYGNSVLYLAMSQPYVKVVLEILRSHHSVNFSGMDGRTPLHQVTKFNNDSGVVLNFALIID